MRGSDTAMKVSVVIPTYNRSALIGRSIDSALNQTVAPYEIIVVDDGSTDDTQKVLQRYSDKIRYLYPENSGKPGIV